MSDCHLQRLHSQRGTNLGYELQTNQSRDIRVALGIIAEMNLRLKHYGAIFIETRSLQLIALIVTVRLANETTNHRQAERMELLKILRKYCCIWLRYCS